jgi:response regulator RpfG family c-di-GMP phosphodiesterase
VATLSVGLAEAVSASRQGWLADVCFSPVELRELRYAGLLHDFGKVGVREHVLVKAKKLYDWQLQNVEERFARVRAVLVAQHSQAELQYLRTHGEQAYLAGESAREAALGEALLALEGDLAVVRQANEPTVLEEDRREHLAAAGSRRYVDLDGVERALLDPAELAMLAIPRGSLTDAERREIESHVVHTVRFLSLIPWTKDLRNVALIAGAHHEKLNGRGYPNALTADGIPVQSRIMTIADIYDALTAHDRPYKRAVPTDAALRILEQEAAAGLVDADLLGLFVDQGIYEVARSPKDSPPQPFEAPLAATAAPRAVGERVG